MNERIKQLMLEAGYVAPEIAGRAHKLAELIIDECVDIIDVEVPGMIGVHAMKKIAERFGVDK
jgi:hypothetical protein